MPSSEKYTQNRNINKNKYMRQHAILCDALPEKYFFGGIGAVRHNDAHRFVYVRWPGRLWNPCARMAVTMAQFGDEVLTRARGPDQFTWRTP
jgi:hypothetical protein